MIIVAILLSRVEAFLETENDSKTNRHTERPGLPFISTPSPLVHAQVAYTTLCFPGLWATKLFPLLASKEEKKVALIFFWKKPRD
jgi:hypothetical protein